MLSILGGVLVRHLYTAVLVAVLTLTAVPAAHAQSWRGSDPAHDHVPSTGENYRGLGDVVGVEVANAPKSVFAHTRFRVGLYDELTINYDTRKARRGPEFYLYKTAYGVTLWSTAGTRDKQVTCADKRMWREGRVWKSRVNRNCLTWNGKRPGAVRVQILSADETYYNAVDYAPGRRPGQAWTPWLKRG